MLNILQIYRNLLYFLIVLLYKIESSEDGRRNKNITQATRF